MGRCLQRVVKEEPMARQLVADPPQPRSRKAGPEHQRLSVFAGHWRTEGQTTAVGGGPELPIRSTDVYEWLPGGFFMIHRWDGHVGGDAVHGVQVIGYDATSGHYQTHFFDNGGNSGSEDLTVSERTWTWLGKQVMGAEWHRCTSIVSAGGNTMRATHDRSADGSSWTPWMDVTLERVT
jgi:hypothetical protein